jgi:GNAT superfamily N-acetyltransferase
VAAEVRDSDWFGRHGWYEGRADGYAEVAAEWVAEGVVDHYAWVPVDDLWDWLRLSFAIQQVYGEIATRDVADAMVPVGVEIREGGPDDIEDALALADLIRDVQRASPVLAWSPDEGAATARADWLEALERDRYLLALRGGRPVGMALVAPRTPVAELVVMATVPDERGYGTGLALLAMVAEIAAREECDRIETDWRIANPYASHFWPERGFKPVAYRMVRHVHGILMP